MKNTFDDWPEPVFLVDPSGNIQHVNEPAVRSFGYTVSAFVGLPLNRLLPNRERQQHDWMRTMYERNPHDRLFTAGATVVCVHARGIGIRAHATFETALVDGQHWTWVMLDVGNALEVPVAGLLEPGDVKVMSTSELGRIEHRFPELTAEFQYLAKEMLPELHYNIFGLMRFSAESGIATMGQLALERAEPIPERGVGTAFSMAGTVSEELLATRRPKLVLAKDEADFRDLYPGSVPQNVPVEFLSSLAVPINRVDGIPGGMLFAQSKKVNAFNPMDVELLAGAAGAIFR